MWAYIPPQGLLSSMYTSHKSLHTAAMWLEGGGEGGQSDGAFTAVYITLTFSGLENNVERNNWWKKLCLIILGFCFVFYKHKEI